MIEVMRKMNIINGVEYGRRIIERVILKNARNLNQLTTVSTLCSNFSRAHSQVASDYNNLRINDKKTLSRNAHNSSEVVDLFTIL